MRFILLLLALICFLNAEINTKPPKRVSACIISANETYINACINGVRYALEAQLADMLYNEYTLTPIFVGDDYSKCTCNIERVRKRVTKQRVIKHEVTYDYDPLTWKIALRPFEVPKEVAKELKKQEMPKQKLRTSLICVKCQ